MIKNINKNLKIYYNFTRKIEKLQILQKSINYNALYIKSNNFYQFSSNNNNNNNSEEYKIAENIIKEEGVSLNENQKQQIFQYTEEELKEQEYLKQLKQFQEQVESGKLNEDNLKTGNFKPIEQDFTDVNHKISFELMNTVGLQDLKDLYNKYENTNELDIEMKCLFYHFFSFLKLDLSKVKEYQDLTKYLLKNIQDMNSDNLRIFVWALGSYILHVGSNVQGSMQSLEIPDIYKKQICDQLLVNNEKLGYTNIIPLSFACVSIFSEQQDQVLLYQLISKFSFLISQNINQFTTEQIVQFIMIFEKVELKDINVLQPFIQHLHTYRQDLEGPQLSQTVQVLSYMNFKDNAINTDFFEQIYDKTNELNLEQTCQVVYAMQVLQKENLEMLEDMLNLIAEKYKYLNISQYINLWLTLAKFKVKPSQLPRFFQIMKKCIHVNEVFELKDLTNEELIQIIIASAALKLNDKEFIEQIISELKVEYLNKEELFNIALSFIVYVKQFTPYYTEIHQQCCFKYDQFNDAEKILLKKTFGRVKTLLPHNSPFL